MDLNFKTKMRFSSVPNESKSQIDRAGEILRRHFGLGRRAPTEKLFMALDLVNRWRACHAYPINTFQSTLRTKLERSKIEAIVAQRLKRMPTIIDKLNRYPRMRLTRMQDIGGVRAVLPSVKSVYDLAESYQNSKKFPHDLVNRKDYIGNPRSEDGYRSIHLNYKYQNKNNPHYDGLRLEMQIRSRLQHLWATAVETMGTFLGQGLKSRQGERKWLDFFAVVSSAFARNEDQPPVPRFSHLNGLETIQEVGKQEKNLDALIKMKGLSLAASQIPQRKTKASYYHLIVLDSLNKSTETKAFNRDSFQEAFSEFSKLEKEAVDGRKIEPVLVSAGGMNNLRRAYPNFFLDIEEFTFELRDMLSKHY